MSTDAICQHSAASVHIEDRGYQFADGVYEVCEVREGFIVDLTRHLDRLGRSLGELQIAWPLSRAAIVRIIRETVRRNKVTDGMFYLQVTRGVAKRDHVFPAKNVRSSLVVTAKSIDRNLGNARAERASASSPCRRTAGTEWTSRPLGCCQTFLPGRRRKRRAPPRRGSSMTADL